MCNFFSCCSNGKGKLLYFDAEARAALRKNNPKNYEPDSHTSIADYHGYPGSKEDTLNKYEFNPLTRKFTIDQINTKDDSVQVGEKLFKLDFKTIVPELIVKPIVNPLAVKRSGTVAMEELTLLKQWTSIWDSVESSVWDSVWASVGSPVWASVWDSVWASVWVSVWDSVWASVGASVRESIWASVGAYVSSFYRPDQWKVGPTSYKLNPAQCCIDLWEAGLVPSFDGKTWRLHTGPKAEIVWEGTL